MALTVSSVNGTKSPFEWYARKLREFAKDQYGIEIKVEIIDAYKDEKMMKSKNDAQ